MTSPPRIRFFKYCINSDVSSEENEGRPPPCVGICYYQKLQALQEREKLLNHNDVLKGVSKIIIPVGGGGNVY